MRRSQQVNKTKIFYKKASLQQRVLAGFVFSGVVGLFVVFALASHYKMTVWHNPCGFKQKYDLPCPTCGITTSVLAFAEGRILESFYTQPAGALLCCVLVVTAFLALLVAFFGVYFAFLKRFFADVKIRYIILAVIIIIAAGWTVTLARALTERY